VADATVVPPDERASLASGITAVGAFLLAWVAHHSLGIDGGAPPGCSDVAQCPAIWYTPGTELALQLVSYTALGVGIIVWIAPWNGGTAFISIVYSAAGLALALFLLVKFGPTYAPLVVALAVLSTLVLIYGISVCPDPLRRPSS